MPYDTRIFHNRVQMFDVQDHARPSMPIVFAFLREAEAFISASDRNIMAIHCKAGKGRTGTMCCVWMLYSREALTAKEALELFAERRTDHIKARRAHKKKLIAVDTWSQVQCVYAVHAWLLAQNRYLGSASGLPAPPPAVPVKLGNVSIHDLLAVQLPFQTPSQNLTKDERTKVALERWQDGDLALECEVLCPAWDSGPGPVVGTAPARVVGDRLEFDFDSELVVQGDFRINVYIINQRAPTADEPRRRYKAGKEPGLLLYLLEHTAFLQDSGFQGFTQREVGDTKLFQKHRSHAPSEGLFVVEFEKQLEEFQPHERDALRTLDLDEFFRGRKKMQRDIEARMNEIQRRREEIQRQNAWKKTKRRTSQLFSFGSGSHPAGMVTVSPLGSNGRQPDTIVEGGLEELDQADEEQGAG